MSQTVIIPVIFQIIGFIVVIAEVMIPSGGLLSILAVGLLGVSIYYLYAYISHYAGLVVFFIDVILIPALIWVGLRLLAKSCLILNTELSRENGVTIQDTCADQLMHKEGRTLTTCRPSGLALIDGKRLNVISRGEFIEKGIDIVVFGISGNQIIVRRKE